MLLPNGGRVIGSPWVCVCVCVSGDWAKPERETLSLLDKQAWYGRQAFIGQNFFWKGGIRVARRGERRKSTAVVDSSVLK